MLSIAPCSWLGDGLFALALALVALQLLEARSDTITEFSEARANTMLSVRYAPGVINGIRIRVPEQYLLHPVVYAGERRDGLGPASTATANDSAIDNFSILVRLSNLQPLTTEEDRQSWRNALSKPLFSRTWMMVSFDNHYPPPPASDVMPRMASVWGPYVREKTPRYGLEHFESVQSVDDGARGLYGHVEYFYRHESRTTIMCQTHRKKVAPFGTFSLCQHRFLVPEFGVMAEAVYTRQDVTRWHIIEQRIKAIVHSFRVPALPRRKS